MRQRSRSVGRARSSVDKSFESEHVDRDYNT